MTKDEAHQKAAATLEKALQDDVGAAPFTEEDERAAREAIAKALTIPPEDIISVTRNRERGTIDLMVLLTHADGISIEEPE